MEIVAILFIATLVGGGAIAYVKIKNDKGNGSL